MNKRTLWTGKIIGWILLFTVMIPFSLRSGDWTETLKEMRDEIEDLMEQGDIPGLSLVVVKGDREVFIDGYGYADVEKKAAVTAGTLFELASCSKSFTALAALQLEEKGLVDLEDPVSKYLPWFYATYNDLEYPVTLKQLLHHTSGLPWETISLIPPLKEESALEQTVKRCIGIDLEHIPGTHYEYTSVNYDIVGTVIEKVSGMSFEDYMIKNLFEPLGLNDTAFKGENLLAGMAQGYKIGFLSPRHYNPPLFRGNNPAAYVISNGDNMAKWLKIQLGMVESALAPLIRKSHIPDRTLPPNRSDLSSYAMGWKIHQKGGGEINHTGLNPTFSTYVGLRPKEMIGVSVLANANSSHTSVIGDYILKVVSGEEDAEPIAQGGGIDNVLTLLTLLLAIFILLVVGLIIFIILGIFRKKRSFKVPNWKTVLQLTVALLLAVPLLLGLYLIPQAVAGFSWKIALVWMPVSFPAVVLFSLAAVGLTLLAFFLALIFPGGDAYLNAAPFVAILSTLTGIANAAALFLVINSFSFDVDLLYILYYFGLAIYVYVVGRKIAHTKLVKLTNALVFDIRMQLIGKIFSAAYQRFENLDSGRIYATLNNDTEVIGRSANVIVLLFNCSAIVISTFIYLAILSFIPTLIVLAVVLFLSLAYYIVYGQARALWEESRDAQNVFLGLIEGLVKGFKELSLHLNKKILYRRDLQENLDTFRHRRTVAGVKFVNVFTFGQSVLIILLGAISFGVPRLFPDIHNFTVMSFLMVLLYLIGPIGDILETLPSVMAIMVSWRRVAGFIKEIPGESELKAVEAICYERKQVENIKTEGIVFEYDGGSRHENFRLGPIDFEAGKGEIIFITGGNGSGKTTFAKVLSGLYIPDEGRVKVNGEEVRNDRLGEYFSIVFSDYHLFKKLYDVDIQNKKKEFQTYLKLLDMADTVQLRGDAFNTIDLSGGQRKRLALLQCYLEDYPIYLFDEWAANQDPMFRKFFYKKLLVDMKEKGKIVIAITHDDHYFDVADRIIKLDMGKVDR